eukprot:380148-Pleurochrysis_carterae.AAC.2
MSGNVPHLLARQWSLRAHEEVGVLLVGEQAGRRCKRDPARTSRAKRFAAKRCPRRGRAANDPYTQRARCEVSVVCVDFSCGCTPVDASSAYRLRWPRRHEYTRWMCSEKDSGRRHVFDGIGTRTIISRECTLETPRTAISSPWRSGTLGTLRACASTGAWVASGCFMRGSCVASAGSSARVHT